MITVHEVSKTYRGRTVLDRVSFDCRPGTVTAFLGPNGAGKSTTMRIIASLATPTSGTATVAGRAFCDLPNPARVLGVMLDTRALSGPRTGAENLRLAARTIGCSPSRVREVLELVGLDAPAAGRRVQDYSLGMRQRLGLAQALLGAPQALMLDEPSNGLDPAGIRWMRHLLRDFADRGGTVLLSSHLLREVEALADRVVLLHQGRVRAQGAMDDFRSSRTTFAQCQSPQALLRRLQAAGLPARPGPDDGLVVDAPPDTVGAVAQAAGIALEELRPHDGGGLEATFLALTTEEAA